MKDALARLLSSHKALVVLAVSIAMFALVFAHRVEWAQASEFLKWVLGPWLLAQGIEDAASKWGSASSSSSASSTTTTASTATAAKDSSSSSAS